MTVVVGFAVGWMFLIMSMFSPDYKGIPLIMGSPLYGSAAATSIVSTASHIVGGEPRYKVAGAILWTCIHGSTAAFLVLAAGELRLLHGPYAGIEHAGDAAVSQEMAGKLRSGAG